MKTLLALLAASVAAIAIQPVVLACWLFLPHLAMGADHSLADVGGVSVYAMVFAVPFVAGIGIPLTLALRLFGRLKWWPLALVGGVAGALFAGWNGPGGDPGFSSGGNWYGKPVDFVVDGVPTLYGWLSYLQSVVAFAMHGVVGATAFYKVWIRMRPNDAASLASIRTRSARKPLRS